MGPNLQNKASQPDPPSLIQPGPDTKFEDTPLDVTLRHFFSRHVASLRFTSLFFAFVRVILRFFTIFCESGSQNGRFSRSFFDKFGLLDEKIDFVKIVLPSRRNAYFQGFGTNRCEISGSKNGCKKRREKKMHKNALKIAFGTHFGAPGRVLDGPGRVRGLPRAPQERLKTAPRAEQECGPSAL